MIYGRTQYIFECDDDDRPCNLVSINQLNVFKFDELDYSKKWQSSPVNIIFLEIRLTERTHEQYLFTAIYHISVDFIC